LYYNEKGITFDLHLNKLFAMTNAITKIIEDAQTLTVEETLQFIEDIISRETKNLDYAETERQTLLIKHKIADAKLLRGRIWRECPTV
jgi:hypothetical protein